MTTKFAVCIKSIETKNGKDALGAYENLTNQDPDTVVAFDNYDAAKAYYDTLYVRVIYNPYNRIFIHDCKWIAEEVYTTDTDGELEFEYENGWRDMHFPNVEEE